MRRPVSDELKAASSLACCRSVGPKMLSPPSWVTVGPLRLIHVLVLRTSCRNQPSDRSTFSRTPFRHQLTRLGWSHPRLCKHRPRSESHRFALCVPLSSVWPLTRLIGPHRPHEPAKFACRRSRGCVLATELALFNINRCSADHIGLWLSAKACYDPREAVGLWERMSKADQVGSPPAFMSTHPSHANRIKVCHPHSTVLPLLTLA